MWRLSCMTWEPCITSPHSGTTLSLISPLLLSLSLWQIIESFTLLGLECCKLKCRIGCLQRCQFYFGRLCMCPTLEQLLSLSCIAKAGYTVFSMVALARFKTRTQRLLGKFL